MQVIRFFLLLSILTYPFKALAEVPFVLCYEDRELLPYFAGSNKTTPAVRPGVSIEIFQLLNNAMPKVHISFRREPWKRCLTMLGDGKVMGVIASYKPGRHKIGVYPMKDDSPDRDRAFEITRYCLYTKANSDFSWNGEVFVGEPPLPVAIPLGYSILDLFKHHGIQVTDVDSSDRGFFLLAKGRVEATATLCESGNQILANNYEYRRIISHSPALRVKGSYLLISHQFYNQHKILADSLWDQLVAINQDNYARIYESYNSEAPSN